MTDELDRKELFASYTQALRNLKAAKEDIERLNMMLRETGYGQGQIDAYAAQCEELEQLRTNSLGAVVERLCDAATDGDLWIETNEAGIRFEASFHDADIGEVPQRSGWHPTADAAIRELAGKVLGGET